MSITINTNIAALNAQRRLSNSTSGLRSSYEKLSSGLRINRASDDAAGLSIADQLKRDVHIANVAIRNANDGISLVSIADGALNEIGNVLTRLVELSEQSSNGALSSIQRSALQNEFQALGSEIQRIAVTTKFNDLSLINGGLSIDLQVGFENNVDSRITISGVQGTLQSLGLNTNGTSSALDNNLSTQANAQSALTAVRNAVGSLSANRGTLGAAESRLNVSINNLQVTRENFQSAESQIRDVDVAEESANLTRLSILQQAGAAILAQANQQPSIALTLLR